MAKRRVSLKDPERAAFSRSQRRQANEFAQLVWQMIRGGNIRRQKFRREHPIGPYTVDFVCMTLQLVIEVDGEGHLTDAGINRDAKRDAYLRELGFEVLRIKGFEVTQDAGRVKQRIESAVEEMLRATSPSPPAPLPEAGRGEEEMLIEGSTAAE